MIFKNLMITRLLNVIVINIKFDMISKVKWKQLKKKLMFKWLINNLWGSGS